MSGQEMIDVYVKGVLVTTVPKASEQHMRRVYSGKPEERTLQIVAHNYKPDPEKLKLISQKLTPKT